MLMMNYSR